jgi:hypothetical protein
MFGHQWLVLTYAIHVNQELLLPIYPLDLFVSPILKYTKVTGEAAGCDDLLASLRECY